MPERPIDEGLRNRKAEVDDSDAGAVLPRYAILHQVAIASSVEM